MAAACGRGPSEPGNQPGAAEAAEVAEVEVDAAPPDAQSKHAETPPFLGEFKLTYYWITNEDSWLAREGEKAKRDTWLYTRECEPIARVSRAFAARLALEGTGVLSDGRTINVSRPCDCGYSPCFFVVDRDKRWGVGVSHRPLSPFRSVAVDTAMVAIGTLLYIPELDGLTVPGRKPWGGFVHDGCVIADDRGGNIQGHQIDLFMAMRPHYEAFNRRHRLKQVTVYDGKGICDVERGEVVRVHRNST